MVLLDSTVVIDYLRGRPGTTLMEAGCLIAAGAVTAGECLATGNPKDFASMPAPAEHWPVGR
jgi:predicted nucleic acid-binding protein